ncbi:alginate lyase family protein [Microbacterium sp. NEAU-LLC]|uniref:Alginate lyase family protein n=1 Tax=Microbacterium helvum TaxID=2773713 RepID=A0ABR8NPH7_9MICO|nr:alginate lyase family protein [Microbacterium helvum]MBD3942550.1 alginate lyase family protein [Microbacterium helvum]
MTALLTVLLVVIVVFPVNGVVAEAASTPKPSPSPTATSKAKATPTPTAKPKATSKASPTPTPTAEPEPDTEPSPDAVKPVVSSAGFTHPGVFDSLDSLETSRKHLFAGDKPWTTIFQQLVSSPYVARDAPDFSDFASAGAVDPLSSRCSLKDGAGCVTYCGSFNVPDVGCTDARMDARAVYAQALMFWYTGNAGYAQRAIAILNAYAQHFRGNTGSNGPLMTAWIGETMLRGAEILRYTYTPQKGDEAFDVEGFSAMLRTTAVPMLSTFDYGPYNGNWKLSATDSLMNIAVFLDDRDLYNRALAMWREAVPAYVYLSEDGRVPASPVTGTGQYQSRTDLSCFWLANKVAPCQTDPKTDPHFGFQNGQSQESCRDFGHTALGLGAMINAAETASIQGDDLYAEQQERIMSGVLYAAQVALTYKTEGWPRGFCDGATDLTTNLLLANLPAEVVYNAYVVRKGVPFSAIKIRGYGAKYPKNDPLAAFIADRRVDSNPVGDVSAWEGLTHRLADKPVPAVKFTEQAPTPTPTPTPTRSTSPTAEASAPTGATLSVAVPIVVAVLVIAMASAASFLVIRRVRRRP